MELSPVGLVLPTRAAYVPPCAPPLTTEAWPLAVQPDYVPVSKSPLLTALPPLPPMVHAIAAVCVSVPLLPVTVTLYVPAAAASAGKPLADNDTEPLNPFSGDIDIVDVPDPVIVEGLAESEKSADAAQP